MKNLILPLLLLGFIFTSCEKGDLSSANELEGIASKAKIDAQKTEEESCSEGNCETAFGRKCHCPSENNCFLNLGFNRWGWSVLLDEYKTYNFQFYAGAGQCELDKGTIVGSVKVTFEDNGNVFYHDFVINDGYIKKEFHFYAGDTEIPIGKNGKATVAPGQYYNEGDKLGDGEVYVILHAVFCGDFDE